MEDITELLNFTVIHFAGQNITFGQLLTVPLTLILGYAILKLFVRLASKALTARQVNPDAVQVVSRALYIIGLVVLFIIALELLQVPVTAFAFVSGAIAIGVGFGAQNIINNFISGWILMWERPIRINDYIEIDTTSGTVEEINTRSTRIRRVDGVHMLVPNSKLLEETVVNWTLIDKLLRCIIRVGVAYGSDVELVRDSLKQVVAEQPLVLSSPEPQVIFEDFGDSALIFDTYFWVNSVGEKSAREIRSDLRFAIEKSFRSNGITIAFPQTDMHLDGRIIVDKA